MSCLARPEKLGELPRCAARNARNLGERERLAQMIAGVLDGSLDPELSLCGGRALEHARHAGDAAAINVLEAHQSFGATGATLHRQRELAERGRIEHVQALERAEDLIERHLEVNAGRLELKARLPARGLDEV